MHLRLVLSPEIAAKHGVSGELTLRFPGYGRGLDAFHLAGEKLAKILRFGGVNSAEIEKLCEVADIDPWAENESPPRTTTLGLPLRERFRFSFLT